MKFLKIVFVALGALIGLGVLLVVVGLIPAVQMWAVRKAVADQPGMEISFGHLAAGFSEAKLADVQVRQDGTTISVKSVDVQYSAMDFLSTRQVTVRQLKVVGVEIDLRQPTPQAAGASPAPTSGSTGAPPEFAGLLNAAQLPVDLILAQLSAEGRALLPEGREVTFDVQGSEIATGKTGTLKWTTTYRDGAKDAAVQTVRNEGAMTIRITAARKIEQVDIDATTTLTGPQLPADRIRAQVAAGTAAGGETYSATVALLRGESTMAKAERLLSVEAAFKPSAKMIEGSWDLAARTEQLGAIMAGLGLPDLDLNGNGQFSFAPSTTAAAFKGDLRVGLARLEAISPELGVIGAVQVNASFEGTMEGDVVSLTRLEWDASDASQFKFAEIRLLQSLGVSLTDQRVEAADAQAPLARVNLNDVPLAWAQPWLTDQKLESGTLALALTVAAEADGKRISVRADTPIKLSGVTVAQGEQKLVEGLELMVNPKIDYTAERIVAEFSELKLSTATGDNASGRIAVEVVDALTKPAIMFTTQLEVVTGSAVKEYLPMDPGPLAVSLAAKGGVTDNVQLRLESLSVKSSTVTPAAALAAIDLLQPLQVNLDTLAFTMSRPAEPTARVKLNQVPLAWVEAFVTDAKLSGSVTGGVLEVSLKAVDDLSIATIEPVTLRGVSATLAGAPQVKDLDLAMDVSAQLKGETVTYDLRRLGVTTTGGAELAHVSAAGSLGLGEKIVLVAKGKADVDVAALAKQPALTSLVVAEQGRMDATFDATMRDTVVDAKVNATLRGFVTVNDKVKLADVDLALIATIDANGKGKVELPLTVVAGKNRSDVLVKGVFTLPPTPASGTTSAGPVAPITFEGAITSARLIVNDLQAFTALMPASPAPAKPVAATATRTIGDRLSAAAGAAMNVTAGTPPPARDTEPFWQGLTGLVTLDLKEVHYGAEAVINNVKGTARISPTGMAVEGLEALMKQEPLKVNGGITFDAKATKPYALAGKVDVKGVAVGPFLQPANLQQRPQLEATVGVNADMKGQGGTLSELMKNTYGVFDVNGTGGVLRMLGKRGETVGKVSSLLGLVGALKGSESTMAAGELASAFNELKFDQFKIRVERGVDLSMKFSTIEFISPIMRLSGTGNIVAQEGVELANQPMNIVFTMGGKGTMAQLLGKTGLLSGETDPQGYSLLQQKFSVGGTPTNPDSSALWRLVTEAGLRAATGFRAN